MEICKIQHPNTILFVIGTENQITQFLYYLDTQAQFGTDFNIYSIAERFDFHDLFGRAVPKNIHGITEMLLVNHALKKYGRCYSLLEYALLSYNLRKAKGKCFY